MKRFPISTILGLTFGVLLAFGAAVSAFQSPTQAPPGGNVPAPINVGPDPQVKSGGLWVGSLGVDGGVVVGGSLTVGKTPTDPKDVVTKGYLDAAFIAAGLADSDKDGVADNLDCAPADNTKWQKVLLYTDSDKDGYGAGQVQTICAGSTAPSGFSTNQSDCYDGNANARPGQTNYFASNRGDGSFDYNCDGTLVAASDGNVPIIEKCARPGGYIVSPVSSCLIEYRGGCDQCQPVSLPADCGTSKGGWGTPVIKYWFPENDSETGSLTGCFAYGDFPFQKMCSEPGLGRVLRCL